MVWPTMSNCRGLMVPRLCQVYKCRDTAEIWWCPDFMVSLQRFCRNFMVPRLCQSTEILQRFNGAPTMSIYRNFKVPRLCQFTETLQIFHGAPTMYEVCKFRIYRHLIKSVNGSNFPVDSPAGGTRNSNKWSVWLNLTSYTVGIITSKINRHLMPLFLLQNSISSRQVYVIATYVLKAFFSASKINSIS